MKLIPKKWKAVICVEIKKMYQYRLNFLGQLLFLPLKLGITFLIWSSIFQNETSMAGYTKITLTVYYLFISIIDFVIAPFSAITYELNKDIVDGKMDLFLTKPLSYIWIQYISKIGNFVIGLIAYATIAVMSSSFINIELYRLCISVIALLLGCTIQYLLFAVIGIMAFRLENVLTLRDNLWNIIKLFSGSIIPIVFYPGYIRSWVELLPFRYMYGLPAEIILDSISLQDSLNKICMSVCWVVILMGITLIFWELSVHNYNSQGG